MNTDEQIELYRKYNQTLDNLRQLSLLSIKSNGEYERDRKAYQIIIDRLVASSEIKDNQIDMLKRLLKEAREEIK
jgi:hypothetical protein